MVSGMGDVHLYIKDHCIETEAKKEFRRLMDAFFTDDFDTGDDEEKIEILRDFLEESDFSELRSSSEVLAGSREGEVILLRDKNGKVTLKVSEK